MRQKNRSLRARLWSHTSENETIGAARRLSSTLRPPFMTTTGRLFTAEVTDYGLKTEREVIPYANIRAILWRNTRVIVATGIPEHEMFCILIRKRQGLPTVLFRRAKLRPSVLKKTIMDVLKTGLTVPLEKETELAEYRHQFHSLLNTLAHKTDTPPKKSWWLFEDAMEIYSSLSRLWS